MKWLLLLLTLPTHNSTARMRLWRALKGLGCAVLRDGAYLLPAREETERALRALQVEAEQAGGGAHLLPLAPDADQSARFCGLFDRAEDWQSFATSLREAGRKLPDSEAMLKKLGRRLRREFEAVAAVDYFPGPSQEQSRQALAEFETRLQARLYPDEPHAVGASIKVLDRARYQRCAWATRRRPWVDRLACAWLIRRFIDREAHFLWLDKPADCPKRALGFDFDGARFTHVGNRVSFETLLASFGLEADAGLVRLGELVHFLDAGGVPVAEAPGVEALLAAMRERITDDDALVLEAGRVFDDLYWTYGKQEKNA
jgi:hypothetical protein